jgi:hypothetical protein
MEAAAVIAHEYIKNLKRDRINEHRRLNSQERRCSGLTNSEWFRLPTRQKSTFSKSKKFACTRLWNYKHVSTEQGFQSLTINIK